MNERTEQRKSMKHLTTAEIQRLLNVASQLSPTQNILIKIGLYTGMRCNEIADLTLGDLIKDRCLISVVSKSKLRYIFVDVNFIESVFEYTAPRTTGRVFINSKTGKPVSMALLQLMIRKAGEKAGLKNLTIQQLRYTFLCNLMNSGLSKSEICKFMGWSDSAETESYNVIVGNGH